MKSRALTMLMATAFCCAAAFAQENVTEETVVNKPDKVTISRDSGSVSITIDGKEGNHEYRYYNRFALSNSHSETLNETEDKREWNFTLPFERNRSKNNNCKGASINVCGFGFGGVKAIDAPRDMSIDPLSSYEFTWNILSYVNDHNRKSRWVHAIGFGLNWRNYRMTGRKRFVKEGDMLTIADYPEGAEPNYSRIKVFSLTVPFTVGYSLNKSTSLQFSPIINFNTYASVKTRYSTDEGRQKDKFKGLHQRPMTIDFQTTLSYKGFGFYVKYSPCSVLNTDFGPKFHGTSAGIVIGY